MTVRQKIVVGAIGAAIVLLLMLLWAFFAWFGKTPIDPLINQIGALITIVVGLIAAFFGHQSAVSRPPALDALPVPGEAASTLTAPLPVSLVAGASPSEAPAPPAAPAAAAPTLQ
ncbi:hypothetical protein F3J20_22490 [Paraburkholderia sp. Cy-641]|uniref:hypothetical protein n=1 Tax=Paraburkholderia sp. Cy-641 TaxID=2608337 RepID=UPI001421D2E4|nr:hypothetical protein [Paraburkholderia sp. Cy-641]NIF80126.1 hypothetical protein [Paraburkholderia sp. Cy-641]